MIHFLSPVALTPAYDAEHSHRFTDFCIDRKRNRLYLRHGGA
jgi:hypothetical protein